MAPSREMSRIPEDRDAFRMVVVVGFGVNLLFIAVWPGKLRWMCRWITSGAITFRDRHLVFLPVKFHIRLSCIWSG